MVVPTVVSPSNPQPGVHLKVDLLRGTNSAGIQGLAALLLSPAETGEGDMTADTEIRTVFSRNDVKDGIGRGPGYFAYQALLANDPKAFTDLIKVTASAGSVAEQTLSFDTDPTVDTAWELKIMGYPVEIEWPVGDSDADAAADAASRINALVDFIACSAASSLAVTTLTARAAGPWGNDIGLQLKRLRGDGVATLGGSTLTGGTTEIDCTQALATAAANEYDYIIPCLSNADSQSDSSSSNPERVKTHINDHNTGVDAKLQQAVYASTGTRAAAKTSTVAINEPTMEHPNEQNGWDLPCEVAAAEAGDRMRRRRLESNANRIGQPLKWLRGAENPEEEVTNSQQFRDAADNGVTVIGYTANDKPRVERPITTYSKDTSGNQDRRVFDVNEVDALYDYFKDLRSYIPQAYLTPDGQVKITKDTKPGDDPPPEGVVEESEVRETIISRTLAFWVPKGVIDGAKFRAAAESGELKVEVNASDETQLDVFIPVSAFKVLAKISLYGAKV